MAFSLNPAESQAMMQHFEMNDLPYLSINSTSIPDFLTSNPDNFLNLNTPQTFDPWSNAVQSMAINSGTEQQVVTEANFNTYHESQFGYSADLSGNLSGNSLLPPLFTDAAPGNIMHGIDESNELFGGAMGVMSYPSTHMHHTSYPGTHSLQAMKHQINSPSRPNYLTEAHLGEFEIPHPSNPHSPTLKEGVFEQELRQVSFPARASSADNPTMNEHPGEPYAKLIYRALMSSPTYSMGLQEIYQWFRDNAPKRTSKSETGWKNSIRHNLSMNAAFKKMERGSHCNGSKKSTEWFLEPFAIRDGVQSTTRYRKGSSLKKSSRCSNNVRGTRQNPERKKVMRQNKWKLQRQETPMTPPEPNLGHQAFLETNRLEIPELNPYDDHLETPESNPYDDLEIPDLDSFESGFGIPDVYMHGRDLMMEWGNQGLSEG